jgi:phosphoribosylglycinamide formyltransferase 1
MSATSRLRLAILISGAGSNMVAITRACAAGKIAADIGIVISDRPAAPGLQRAGDLGIPTTVVDAASFSTDGGFDRAAFEDALEATIDGSQAGLVVLAGFMRILSAGFVERYAGRMLNIHPSLLPRYKGLETHARVLESDDRTHGATVHYVTAELDGGPAVLQAEVPVLPSDDVDSLSARVHEVEHIIYPQVISWIAAGRLRWNDGAPVLDGVRLDQPARQQ